MWLPEALPLLELPLALPVGVEMLDLAALKPFKKGHHTANSVFWIYKVHVLGDIIMGMRWFLSHHLLELYPI